MVVSCYFSYLVYNCYVTQQISYITFLSTISDAVTAHDKPITTKLDAEAEGDVHRALVAWRAARESPQASYDCKKLGDVQWRDIHRAARRGRRCDEDARGYVFVQQGNVHRW